MNNPDFQSILLFTFYFSRWCHAILGDITMSFVTTFIYPTWHQHRSQIVCVRWQRQGRQSRPPSPRKNVYQYTKTPRPSNLKYAPLFLEGVTHNRSVNWISLHWFWVSISFIFAIALVVILRKSPYLVSQLVDLALRWCFCPRWPAVCIRVLSYRVELQWLCQHCLKKMKLN